MNKVLEFILVLVVAATALNFGGTESLGYTLMEAGIFTLLLLVLVGQIRRGKIRLPLPIWPVLFVLVAVFEILPLPRRVVELLSPHRLAAMMRTTSGGAVQRWMSLSIYPHDSILGVFKLLAYLGAFVLAAYWFDSSKRKSTLVRGLIILGCFEAGYGIFQYLSGWQKIFGYTKIYDVADATGTYINRNHFAGLLELTLPFVFATAFYWYSVSRVRSRSPSHKKSREAPPFAIHRALFFLFVSVIFVVAAVLSRSRTGILTMLFTLVIMGLLAQIGVKRKFWSLGLILFLACVSAYAMWIGLNPVLARFERLENPDYLEVEGRLTLWRDGVSMLRDYPLTGTGIGTFGTAYRRYQTFKVEKYANHVHNDYLEFADETGPFGAALLFLPILYLLVKMTLAFLKDSRRYRRAVMLACIGSLLALLIHSLTDFNLQIPANALIFAVVLGIGYKAACVEPRAEKQTPAIPSRELL